VASFVGTPATRPKSAMLGEQGGRLQSKPDCGAATPIYQDQPGAWFLATPRIFAALQQEQSWISRSAVNCRNLSRIAAIQSDPDVILGVCPRVTDRRLTRDESRYIQCGPSSQRATGRTNRDQPSLRHRARIIQIQVIPPGGRISPA